MERHEGRVAALGRICSSPALGSSTSVRPRPAADRMPRQAKAASMETRSDITPPMRGPRLRLANMDILNRPMA